MAFGSKMIEAAKARERQSRWICEPGYHRVRITHWEYQPGAGKVQRLELEDVIHFRHGIDPNNTRLGLSPLHSVIREIFIDLEASNFSASMLRNLGIPGLAISPKNDQTRNEKGVMGSL